MTRTKNQKAKATGFNKRAILRFKKPDQIPTKRLTTKKMRTTM